MARAGMSHLITLVRSRANLGTADYTINGTAYWTDDQIEDHLDRHRRTYKSVYLEGLAEIGSGGTAYYYDYPLPARHVEGTATGWSLITSVGGTAPTYTVDVNVPMVTFNADTEGSAYYWTGRGYDVNLAVADIWESKAAQIAAGAVDWSSDNHRVSQSKQIENYMTMARQYRQLAGPQITRRFRVDER